MSESGSIAAKMSTAQLRKIKKPIIERRRRGRINESLNQLKALVLEALHKDESRYSKMEKADILEMTVKHLKAVQKQQAAMTTSIAMVTGQDVYGKYHTGFNECAHEIHNYLGQMSGVTPDVQGRLMQHLEKVSLTRTPATTQTVPSATPLTSLPGSPFILGMTQPLSVAVPPVVAVMSPPPAASAGAAAPSTPASGAQGVNLNSAIPLYISPRAASSPGSSSAASSPLSTCTSPSSSASSRSSTPSSPAPSDDVPHYTQTVLHHQMVYRDVTRTSPIVIEPSAAVWRPW